MKWTEFRTQNERVKELAKEFAEDSVVLDALKAKYPEAFEREFTWTVTLHDSYGPTSKHIIKGGRGDISQYGVAEEVARFLKGKLESFSSM